MKIGANEITFVICVCSTMLFAIMVYVVLGLSGEVTKGEQLILTLLLLQLPKRLVSAIYDSIYYRLESALEKK